MGYPEVCIYRVPASDGKGAARSRTLDLWRNADQVRYGWYDHDGEGLFDRRNALPAALLNS